jgi:hypothetical protein
MYMRCAWMKRLRRAIDPCYRESETNEARPRAQESFTPKTVAFDPWKVQHMNHQLHLQRKDHVGSDRQPYCSSLAGSQTRGSFSGGKAGSTPRKIQ